MWIFWLLVGSMCSVWIAPRYRMGGGNVPMTPNYPSQAPSQVHFSVYISACHGMLVLCVYKYVRTHFCVCVFFGLCVWWVEVSSCQLSLRLWPIVDWLLWWEKSEVFFSPGLVLQGSCGCVTVFWGTDKSPSVIFTTLHNLGSPQVTFCQM